VCVSVLTGSSPAKIGTCVRARDRTALRSMGVDCTVSLRLLCGVRVSITRSLNHAHSGDIISPATTIESMMTSSGDTLDDGAQHLVVQARCV
jgi:hypothetical protein